MSDPLTTRVQELIGGYKELKALEVPRAELERVIRDDVLYIKALCGMQHCNPNTYLKMYYQGVERR